MIKHWVALSGGIDSCVLLHFLATHFPQLSLHAIHINHGLHPQANVWQKHCRQVCKSLDVPLRIVSIQINCKKGESLEARARIERYQGFASIMKKNDVIFMAHHSDDQAETLLLQLLRGAGLRGVAAMPAIAHFANGYLIRPLLNFSRADIEHYANTHQLRWVEDPSNDNQQFDRNYLRQTIFPLLKKRWPQAHKIMARFAKHCAEQEHLIESIAAQDYRDCHGEYLNTLSIPALLKYDATRRNNLLRFYIHTMHLPSPPENLLKELNRLFHAKRDAMPTIHWNNVYFRRYREHLIICRSKSPRRLTASTPFYKGGKKTNLPATFEKGGSLAQARRGIFEILTEEEIKWCNTNLPYKLSNPNLSIKFRQGGERFIPSGKKHSRPLKKLFQEWKIPPWLRDQIPLIYYNDKILAVVGFDKGNANATFND